MDDKKALKQAKNIFNKLKTDSAGVVFAEELLDARLLKKLKKLKYDVDKLLQKLLNIIDHKSFFNEDKAPIRAEYIEKREIDRSTLYSSGGPFQLLHVDIGNLEYLGKDATFPQYVLVTLDLFSSKICTHSMKFRKQILQKLNLFYNDVGHKRKGRRIRLQVDNEFQQVKIKDLNDEKNVEMFTTSVRGALLLNKKLENSKRELQKSTLKSLRLAHKK